MMPETQTWDSMLSYEIYSHIFSFLDFETLNRIKTVCKTWNELQQQKSVWRNVVTEQLESLLEASQSNQIILTNNRLRGPNCQIFPTTSDENETEEIKIVNSKIKRGTPEQLINLFSSPFSAKKYTEKDLDVFLTVYEDFVSPAKLLYKLLQNVETTFEKDLEVLEGPYYVILKWIQLAPEDFNKDFLTLLYSTIKYIQYSVDIENCQTVAAVKNYFKTARKRAQSFASPLITFKPFDSQNSPPSILNFDAKEFAEYLTVIEHNISSHIQRSELFHRAWKTDQRRQVAPNVTEAIRRFSVLSSWLASSVLAQQMPAERAKVIVHFVDIVTHLRKLKNFNAISAIVGGLSSAAVFRLKKTWEYVPKKVTTILDEEEEELMGARANYAAYRQKMRSIADICFPYMGMLLSDLTFIDDGNAALRNGQIRFSRLYLINDVLEDFFIHVRKPFPLQGYKPSPKMEELMSYIYGGTQFNDNDLYRLSLEREPKTVN